MRNDLEDQETRKRKKPHWKVSFASTRLNYSIRASRISFLFQNSNDTCLYSKERLRNDFDKENSIESTNNFLANWKVEVFIHHNNKKAKRKVFIV